MVWLAAMLTWVAFAVRFRDAVWLSVVERPWLTSVFLQGAVVFSSIVTIAAAGVWGLAAYVSSASPSTEVAGALCAFNGALVRFAAWGLSVPVLVVGAALRERSRLGATVEVAAVFVATGLLLPFALPGGLYGFVGWLMLVAATLWRHGTPRVEPVPATTIHRSD